MIRIDMHISGENYEVENNQLLTILKKEVNNGQNLWISGNARTGKSIVAREICDAFKDRAYYALQGYFPDKNLDHATQATEFFQSKQEASILIIDEFQYAKREVDPKRDPNFISFIENLMNFICQGGTVIAIGPSALSQEFEILSSEEKFFFQSSFIEYRLIAEHQIRYTINDHMYERQKHRVISVCRHSIAPPPGYYR